MRKLSLFQCLFMCLILTCCSGKETKEKDYKYEDFENYKISWNSLFFIAKTQYFVYIYGENCLHCQNIKNDVLSFVNSSIFSTFLLPYSDEIPTGLEIEKTIGAAKIEEVFILGVPTLLEIDNNVLTSNVAGTTQVLALLYSKKK